MVVDYFLKVGYFVACNKTNDVTLIVELYFKEVMTLHGILRFIALECDTKDSYPLLDYIMEEDGNQP